MRRTKQYFKNVYANILKILKNRGLKTQFQILENEASGILKEFITEKHIDYQSTPDGIHHLNWSERVIQTCKNNFLGGLCSNDPDLTLNLWWKLLYRSIVTINLLWTSRINPNSYTHAQIVGNFDYNLTPISPPVIKVILCELAEYKSSWYSHALYGCCIGPSLEHYFCHQILIPVTN